MCSINSKMLLLVAAFVVLLCLLNQNVGAEKIIVLYNGKKYDLTEFHKSHPGGEEVLKKVNGKDVKEYLEGKKGVKTDHLVQHKHSKHTINEFLPTLEIKH